MMGAPPILEPAKAEAASCRFARARQGFASTSWCQSSQWTSGSQAGKALLQAKARLVDPWTWTADSLNCLGEVIADVGKPFFA